MHWLDFLDLFNITDRIHGWHMFLASIGGIHIAFFIGAWAIMALAMVASLAGLTR